MKTKSGVKFLGVILFPTGRKLSKRNMSKIADKLEIKNAGSYLGVLGKHCNSEKIKEFQWRLAEFLFKTMKNTTFSATFHDYNI